MAEQLFTAYAAGGQPTRLLFASRNNGEQYRPVVLATAGGVYAPGTIIFGADADPATVWAKVATGAMPAATDLIAVVTESADATAENRKHFAAVGNCEFVEEALWDATGGSLSAGNKTTLREAMLRQGINLRNAAYQSL